MDDDAISLAHSKCLICSTPNSALHFGIESCRACTSFFKRVQLSGRRPPCRRGDHNCDRLRGNANGSICRGCRYDKCESLGMTYDGPMRKNNPKCKLEKESRPQSLIVEESLLDRIAREHKACTQRRLIREEHLLKIHNLIRLPHPTEEVYQANFDFAVASFNVNLTESWNFFLAVFPSIEGLCFEDQRELFRMCIPQFALVDCFNRTKRIWGLFSENWMCSIFGCSNLQKPEIWMGPQRGGAMQEELLETIRAYIADQMTIVKPSFVKADLRDREIHALLALLLCEAELQGDFAERFLPFLDEIRTQVLEELHHFYTEDMGLSEYSTRLGTLVTLCHTFREANTIFQEFFRMQVTVFDLYSSEKLLNELLL